MVIANMPPAPSMIATCACGEVEVRAFGKPIVSAACYCDDCQKGAAEIEALPNAPAVRDPDGGTAYTLYRNDRFECSRGAERLKRHKLKETSPTNRVVATCCNSAMFVNFDRGPHWVSAYRARFHADPPPLQARDLHEVQTGWRCACGRCAELQSLSAKLHHQAARLAHRNGARKMNA